MLQTVELGGAELGRDPPQGGIPVAHISTSANASHHAGAPKGAEQKLFTSSFLRILTIQFAFGVSFSSFLLLPKFLRVELGAGPEMIGALGGMAVLWGAICAPFVGQLSARVGRKSVLLLALVFEGTGALGFVFVDSVGPLIFVLRSLQGLGFVLVFNATSTLAADLAPPRQMAKAVGFLGVSMMTTNALAPIVVEPLAETYGWTTCFLLAGLVVLSAAPLIARVLEPPARPQALSAARRFNPQLLAVHYGSLVMGAGLGVMFTFIQPFAIERGATQVGAFFLGYVPVALFVRIALGSLADRFGHLRTAALAMLVYALVVGASSRLTPPYLALSGAGLGLAHGFLYPALGAAGLLRVGQAGRSVFMGWFACAFNAGFALAVLALGRLAKQTGYPAVFLLTAAFIASGILVLGLAFARPREPAPVT